MIREFQNGAEAVVIKIAGSFFKIDPLSEIPQSHEFKHIDFQAPFDAYQILLCHKIQKGLQIIQRDVTLFGEPLVTVQHELSHTSCNLPKQLLENLRQLC